MMKHILYKAETRGHANHGWLDTHHTFSFADYHNPERVHFGALRVLNDDIVKGGEGFGRHPHDNMEIISIPLRGALRHGDSMGNGGVIEAGDVQVMSAGTGVFHSEFNARENEDVNFFQIWVFPNKRGVEPRYEQKKTDFLQHKNQLCEIVTPEPTEHSLWIYQEAWFHIGLFDRDEEVEYKLKNPKNGVFIMIIQGGFNVSGIELDCRDGLGVWETDKITVKSLGDDSQILLMEVPMSF
jgi:redox-sensitive bicupin YhaK (pirin superfamily)